MSNRTFTEEERLRGYAASSVTKMRRKAGRFLDMAAARRLHADEALRQAEKLEADAESLKQRADALEAENRRKSE